MFDQVVAREVLEEFAAVPGAVVRVGAEAEVEEGEVGDAVGSFLVSIVSLSSSLVANRQWISGRGKLTQAPQQKAP